MMPDARARLALAFVAATLCVAACSGPPDAAAGTRPREEGVATLTPEQLTAISVQPVSMRNERVVATLPAQLVPDEDHTVRILSPVTGRIESLDVEPGARVAAGQALAHIASGDVAQAGSELAKASAVLAQARAALQRTRDLQGHGVAAQKDVEQAQSDEAQANAEYQRALSRAKLLGAAGEAPGELVLRSPIAGEVLDRTANPGAEVRPDATAPLFTVSSLDTLWLTAEVYQRDLAAVRPGGRLVFESDALPGRRFEARVSYVAGGLDPQTRTALVRATLPNAGHALKALETGTARLYAPAATPELVVPSRALVTHGAETVVVLRAGPRRFVRRTVQVGDDDGTTATIVSGLSLGDSVVVDGSLLVVAAMDHGS